MGSLRRGLIFAALPSPAFASVCDTVNPDWDGTPVTALQEAISLATTPLALVLLGLTLVVIRFRSQWGGLALFIFWTGYASLVTIFDPTGVQEIAIAEGCRGPTTLFIGLVAAICIAMILYTAPHRARETDGET